MDIARRSCRPQRRREGAALIEAYSRRLQGRAVVEGRDSPEMKACDLAAVIASAISGNAQDEKLIEDLTRSLELCLNGEIDLSTRQQAEAVLRRAGRRRPTS